jgi:hypothetical protein
VNGRTVGVVLMLIVVLPAVGCGLGDKQHRADAIIDSVDRSFAAGTARGTLAVRVEVLQVPDVGRQAEAANATGRGVPQHRLSPPFNFSLAVDFAHRRAQLQRDAKHAEVFDDLDFYATRLGISERDARPWLRLRLADLEEGTGEIRVPDDSPTSLVSAINPIVLVDLAAGALAGSIKTGVADTLGGVPVTRYSAAFDVDKTFDKTRHESYSEDDRKTINTAFSLLTVKGGVNKGTAWVDGDGRLRRFQLELRVSRQRDLVFGVQFDLVLDHFGEPVDVAVPDDTSILEADSMVAFLRSVVPELASRTTA